MSVPFARARDEESRLCDVSPLTDTISPSTSTQLELRKTVVLVGMMGCGKTAVGTELSRLLNVPFLDSDQEIVKAANAPVAEIFERDGETFFRDRETAVIARLLKGEPGILSTGGGAFLAERNRNLIDLHGISVWLDAPLDVLWNRVRHKSTRPLLLTDNPKGTLTEIFETRQPVYELAALRVPTDGKISIAEMAARVKTRLLTRPDVLALKNVKKP